MILGRSDDAPPLPPREAVVCLEGRGFRTGRPNRVRIRTAPPGTRTMRVGDQGFDFGVGMDLARFDTTARCLRYEGIGPLEHALAALAIRGVRGWSIEMEHGDIPLFDGSATSWDRAIRDLGAIGVPDVRECSGFAGAWTGSRGGVEAVSAESFRLDVQWSRGPRGAERWVGGIERLSELLEARTFVEASDLIGSGLLDRFEGLDPDSGRLFRIGPATGEMVELAGRLGVDPREGMWFGGPARMPAECAAHKALDLVGDIAAQIGYLPRLAIHARDAGHGLHQRLAEALREHSNRSEESRHATDP